MAIIQYMASKEQSEVRVWEQRKVFGAKIKNMWDGQILDTSIDYIISVIPSCSWVFNKLLNPKPCYMFKANSLTNNSTEN